MNLISNVENVRMTYEEQIPFGENRKVTNNVVLENYGFHASHIYHDGLSDIKPLWEVGRVSQTETRGAQSIETIAEFFYTAKRNPADSYDLNKMLIIERDPEQTEEHRRSINYDKNGNIVEDTVYIAPLLRASIPGYGLQVFRFDEKTGRYLNEAGKAYDGDIAKCDIANPGTYERLNILRDQGKNFAPTGIDLTHNWTIIRSFLWYNKKRWTIWKYYLFV